MKIAKFALFFTTKPAPSAQVVRADQFEDKDGIEWIAEGQEREWVTTKGNIPGRILRIGTRNDMKQLKVTRGGEVRDKDAQGEYFVKTLRLEKQQQNQAKDSTIRDMDTALHEGGFQALERPPTPVPKPDRRPKKRSSDHLESLQETFQRLSCFTHTQNDTQISSKNVFVNNTELHYIKQLYSTEPSRMFTALLEACVPDDILKQDGISFRGRGATVQFPPDIVKASLSYTARNSKGMPFDTKRKIRNFIWDKRDPAYKPVPVKGVARTARPTWTAGSASPSQEQVQQDSNEVETASLLHSAMNILG